MQRRRILIVDNNDELRAILENALESLGCEAVVTGDRDEALSRKDLDQFDLIISDLTEEDTQSSSESTGQSTGLSTAQANGKPANELHRRHLLTPVTSNAEEPVIVKAFKLVAANYLRLPANKDQLRESD